MTTEFWLRLDRTLQEFPTGPHGKYDVSNKARYKAALECVPDEAVPELIRRLPLSGDWLPGTRTLLTLAADIVFGPVPTAAEALARLHEGIAFHNAHKSDMGYNAAVVMQSFLSGSKTAAPNGAMCVVINALGGFDKIMQSDDSIFARFTHLYEAQAKRETERRLLDIIGGEKKPLLPPTVPVHAAAIEKRDGTLPNSAARVDYVRTHQAAFDQIDNRLRHLSAPVPATGQDDVVDAEYTDEGDPALSYRGESPEEMGE